MPCTSTQRLLSHLNLSKAAAAGLVEGKMWKGMKGTGQLCTMWWVVKAYAAASLSGRIKMLAQYVGMKESMGHDGRCHA